MRSLSNQEDAEDILHDALAFLGGEPVIDNDTVSYGEIVLTVAAKVSLYVSRGNNDNNARTRKERCTSLAFLVQRASC